MYVYLEASDYEPQSVASLMSPLLPLRDEHRCLEFMMSAYGKHVGKVLLSSELGHPFWNFTPSADICEKI